MTEPEDRQLTHLDEQGRARMVDVSHKDVTRRVAKAEAHVRMAPATRAALFAGDLPKGDALAVARIAGIMGAKRTADLVPLCHPLPIDAVAVNVEETDDGARIVAEVTTTGRTGVEMEALTAASVAALALYDMVKAVERGVEIVGVRLLHKSGGRSGVWERTHPA